ncbi:MAG: DUF6362 family protein [Gluconobacter cerinus]|uniref:DUF6362 family protein n=1 Tax=Gluconobacter cerinus TaxID=38307 RepID=UPI0039E85FF6
MKRRHRMDLSHDVPKQVAEWMDEAALTLAALPAHGLRPSGARGFWPDIVPDEEDLEWARDSDILPPRPTPDDVSRMDLVFSWLTFLGERNENREVRLVVQLYMRVHPISGKHLLSWEKIGRKLGIGRNTAQRRYLTACCLIAEKIRTGQFPLDRLDQIEHFPTS